MNWNHFNDNETKAGVEGRWAKYSSDHVVFYIHGTNHKMDWARNLQIFLTKIKGKIRVNRQDLREAQWVVEYITNHIDLSAIKKLTIGGHSRGGAIAQIVVLKLIDKYPHIDTNGVLLASKRTGNRHFVHLIQNFVTAYRHRGDIVPHIPFWPFYRNPKTILFGKWTPLFWRAHQVKSYNQYMDKYHLR